MERYDLMGTPTASSEEAGVLRIASEVDEKNCGCVDAAITPSNLYNLLGCRKANTSYKAGDVVACPYHVEFLLNCVTAGSTATSALDTTNVTKGQVIADGGVKWEVIAKAIIDASISGKKITVTFIDGTQKTLTTQDTAPFTARATSIGGASTTKPAVVVTTYRSGTTWYRKYSDGWIEQGGVTSITNGRGSVTFPTAFSSTDYTALTGLSNVNNQASYLVQHDNRTKTSMGLFYGSYSFDGVYWYACGY